MYELLIIISAVVYSTSGVWNMLEGTENVSAMMLVTIRLFFMVVFAGMIIIIRKKSFRLNKAQFISCALFGVSGMSLTMFLFTLGVKEMSVGPTALCHYSYPLFVAVISSLIYKEKFGVKRILATALMFLGLYLSNSGGTMTFFGTFCALASAVTFGLYVFGQDHSAMREMEPMTLFFYNALFSLLACIVVLFVTNDIILPSDYRVYGYMSIAALLCEMVGAVLLSIGVRKIGATKASYLSVLEPLSSYIWDFLFFGALITTKSLLGMVFIFISFFLTLFVSPKNKKA